MSLSAKTKVRLSYLPQCIDLLLKLTLLIILIGVIVPFSPKMPAPGLDSSWALGLNEAIAQRLSFGKEIIFTLGPYSSIYTKAYHPATDLMMIGGSLYLACSYWLSLILLMSGIKWRWTVALGICLLSMIYARDSLFFTYPLLAGLANFKIISTRELAGNQRIPMLCVIVLLFAPFGLLPLIKSSILILCLSVTLLCTLFFVLNKKNSLALICLVSPIASMLLFWIGSGQSIINLPHYFVTSLSLAAGFTEAMANEGNNNEIILYLGAAVLILCTIAWQKAISIYPKLFLLSLFFVFLFLSFKTGFTRHYGHAFISGTSILIAGLLLPYIFKARFIIPIIIASTYTASSIDGHYTKISVANNIVSTYSSAWHGFKNRVKEKNWLSQNFALTMQFLKEQSSFPLLQGTTDIYSYNQAYLIASKMRWSPRPIFQSYSVFTPELARKNKEHLLGKNRPDNIIFRVEPIDGRIPSLEDGASWPVLLQNYHPVQLANNFLYLHKKNTERYQLKSINVLKSESHILGEVVNIPDLDEPLFAQINIKPTVLGSLAITFFKPKPLQITFELKNGGKKQYSIVANMAQSDFLLSPLIENTDEFALLYSDIHLLDNKQIKSISITSNQNNIKHWNDEYVIHFKSTEK
ncbi:hypothetical protein [Legionella maioricensis]|uniref:hypothetical protein n=1 Tax=Legionella maioricensis TaxID=2896528 RepID=UPI003D6CA81A